MRRIAATLAVVGVLLFSAGSAWADYDDGLAAYERGDYATALQKWLPLAEQGGAMAQAMIGSMYDEGMGVPQNDAEAVKWYRRAAEQGITQAQTLLGTMYYGGEGIPENYVKACMWWLLAKAQGDKNAARGLEIVKKQMTPFEIAKAKALAAEWSETRNPNAAPSAPPSQKTS